jgi:hypothetical protein
MLPGKLTAPQIFFRRLQRLGDGHVQLAPQIGAPNVAVTPVTRLCGGFPP